jgi:hypothetical protein
VWSCPRHPHDPEVQWPTLTPGSPGGKATAVPAHRGQPARRPRRRRDGDLPHLCLSLVGPLSAGRPAGLIDRSSRAHTHPGRLPAAVEAEICRLRQAHKLGPARIATRVRLAPSTMHRIRCRHGLNRLAWMDRPTGQPIRRYERAHPGELIHLDVKKLGRLRDGGGHRIHGRDSTQHRTRDQHRARRGRSAMTMSRPPSTTTPAWPMSRSWPTSAAQPVQGFYAAPGSSWPPMASPSNGC